MKRYIAYTGKNNRITSVIATDENAARKRIREQLDRPGRRGFLRLWQEDGEKIKEDS